MSHNKNNVLYIIFALVKLLNMVFFVAHFLGSGFHFIAIYEASRNQNIETWLKAYEYSELSQFERYIHSLYFSIISMSTIGYGDISPQSINERIYIICSTCISCGVFGYSLNVVTTIFQDLSNESYEFRKQKSDIIMYMVQREIKNDLQIKVIKNFEHQQQMEQSGISKSNQILNGLSQGLVKDIKYDFYFRILQQITLFHSNFSDQFLQDLSQVMQEQTIAPDEILLDVDQATQKLFYIFKGTVGFCKKIQNNRGQLKEIILEQKNERYYQIQDQLKYEQDHDISYRYIFCDFCKHFGHQQTICPYLQPHINKRLCLNKYIKQEQKVQIQIRNNLPIQTLENRRYNKYHTFFDQINNQQHLIQTRCDSIAIRKKYVIKNVQQQQQLYSNNDQFPFDFFQVINNHIQDEYTEELNDELLLEMLPGIIINNKINNDYEKQQGDTDTNQIRQTNNSKSYKDKSFNNQTTKSEYNQIDFFDYNFFKDQSKLIINYFELYQQAKELHLQLEMHSQDTSIQELEQFSEAQSYSSSQVQYSYDLNSNTQTQRQKSRQSSIVLDVQQQQQQKQKQDSQQLTLNKNLSQVNEGDEDQKLLKQQFNTQLKFKTQLQDNQEQIQKSCEFLEMQQSQKLNNKEIQKLKQSQSQRNSDKNITHKDGNKILKQFYEEKKEFSKRNSCQKIIGSKKVITENQEILRKSSKQLTFKQIQQKKPSRLVIFEDEDDDQQYDNNQNTLQVNTQIGQNEESPLKSTKRNFRNKKKQQNQNISNDKDTQYQSKQIQKQEIQIKRQSQSLDLKDIKNIQKNSKDVYQNNDKNLHNNEIINKKSQIQNQEQIKNNQNNIRFSSKNIQQNSENSKNSLLQIQNIYDNRRKSRLSVMINGNNQFTGRKKSMQPTAIINQQNQYVKLNTLNPVQSRMSVLSFKNNSFQQNNQIKQQLELVNLKQNQILNKEANQQKLPKNIFAKSIIQSLIQTNDNQQNVMVFSQNQNLNMNQQQLKQNQIKNQQQQQQQQYKQQQQNNFYQKNHQFPINQQPYNNDQQYQKDNQNVFNFQFQQYNHEEELIQNQIYITNFECAQEYIKYFYNYNYKIVIKQYEKQRISNFIKNKQHAFKEYQQMLVPNRGRNAFKTKAFNSKGVLKTLTKLKKPSVIQKDQISNNIGKKKL